MINRELTRIFALLTDGYEFKGENQFKINAYRKASGIIKDFPIELDEYIKEKALTEIPGIGEGIAKKITEYVDTGQVSKFQELMKEVPAEIFDMLNIPYIGPKTLRLAYQKLGVDSLIKLKKAISVGSFSLLPRMGKKKTQKIYEAIQLFEKSEIGKNKFVVGD